MKNDNVDPNDIIPFRTITKEGVKEFYINNIPTSINNVEFIEDNDSPFLIISPSGIQVYVCDMVSNRTERGLDAITGRRHNKYTITVQKEVLKTEYKFVLMSDGDLEVPGGLL